MATEIPSEDVKPSPATIAVILESAGKYKISAGWSRLFFI